MCFLNSVVFERCQPSIVMLRGEIQTGTERSDDVEHDKHEKKNMNDAAHDINKATQHRLTAPKRKE